MQGDKDRSEKKTRLHTASTGEKVVGFLFYNMAGAGVQVALWECSDE